jgi:hypothetical protein
MMIVFHGCNLMNCYISTVRMRYLNITLVGQTKQVLCGGGGSGVHNSQPWCYPQKWASSPLQLHRLRWNHQRQCRGALPAAGQAKCSPMSRFSGNFHWRCLTAVPPVERQRLWLQCDGAPAHYREDVRHELDVGDEFYGFLGRQI